MALWQGSFKGPGWCVLHECIETHTKVLCARLYEYLSSRLNISGGSTSFRTAVPQRKCLKFRQSNKHFRQKRGQANSCVLYIFIPSNHIACFASSNGEPCLALLKWQPNGLTRERAAVHTHVRHQADHAAEYTCASNLQWSAITVNITVVLVRGGDDLLGFSSCPELGSSH